nr:hypothetical protein BaRGS_030166 [Batillaria attramentaria]
MQNEKSEKRKEKAVSRAFEREILELSSGGSDSEDSEEDGGGGRVHKLPDRLEVASDDDNWGDSDDGSEDDSDREEKKPKASGKLITMAMVKTWTSQLQV